MDDNELDEQKRFMRSGTRIKAAREAHQWTQTDLAGEVSRISGREVKQRAISKWESGKGRPSMAYVTALEEVLGLPPGLLWITYYPEVDLGRRQEEADRLRQADPSSEDTAPEGAAGATASLEDLIAERDRIEKLIQQKFRNR